MSRQQACSAFVYSVQGERDYQEDTYVVSCQPSLRVFGVFDGHSGGGVSLLLKRHLVRYIRAALAKLQKPIRVSQVKAALKQAFRAFDLHLFHGRMPGMRGKRATAGSTAIVLVQLNHYVFLVNTGDSRAILVDAKGKILQATQDHKPNVAREAKRIRAAGGRVLTLPGEPPRVDGNLALSRAFGDFSYKVSGTGTYLGSRAKVIVDPDVTHYILPARQVYAVLASDGLWDVVRSIEVARSIRYAAQGKGVSMAQVPRALVHLAVKQRRSGDNTTVVIAPLHRDTITPLSTTHRTVTKKQTWTYKRLYALAQRRNLRGRSTYKKAELARKLGIRL